MAASSLAGELLEIINENRYKTVFKHLSEDNVVSSDVIKSLKKDKSGGRDYDTSRFQNRQGNIKPDGLYSLFTKYAGENCSEIRDKLSSWVIEHRSALEDLTSDSFKTHKTNFNWWNLAIINKRRPGDELSLFCLCKIYHRHAIIYTEIDYWTTLEDTENLTEEEIVSKCDIVLVYLGDNKFCEVVKTKNDSETTLCKRVTKSLRELCSGSNITDTAANTKKSSKTETPRVKLNPTKHEHDTRGSVRKRHNDRPNRVQSRTVSYVPDPTSSESENEPPRKRRHTRYDPNEIGPSQTRIEAQRMITRQKLQTKANVTSRLIGTCVVSPPAKPKEESGDNKLNIKMEIKIEQSKPLTKEQKERRRRRNRKEDQETEWEHLHYRPGKGFLEHCEHTLAQCKFTNMTPGTNTPTDDQKNETSANDINQNKDNNSVNTKNAKEKEKENVESNSTDSAVNTINTKGKESETSTPVNTENEDRESNRDLKGDSDTEGNKSTLSITNKKDTETNDCDAPPNLMESVTEPTTTCAKEPSTTTCNDTTTETNPRKLRDAVDGLLLLSSGEETMDELALSQDEDDTIEFNEELDMENMMTALHLDKHNGEPASTNSDSPTLSTALENSSGSTGKSSRSVNNKNAQNRTPAQSTSSKGQIKIRNISLKRRKEPSRNYYCSTCDDNIPYKGLQALNIHHRENHNPVQCGVCSKWCSTPESLRRHSYDHYNKTEICTVCGETFHFKSELKSHLIIHDEREGIHQCMKGGCGKRYMRKGELVAHVKTHTGKLWKCPWKTCTYEAIDKQYLYQHKKGHSKNNYICKYCQEGFTHYMQRKRHYEKSHSQ